MRTFLFHCKIIRGFFAENVDVSKAKFKQVVFYLLKCLYEKQ